MKTKKPDLVQIYQTQSSVLRLIIKLNKLVLPPEYSDQITLFKQHLQAGLTTLEAAAEAVKTGREKKA